MIRVAIAVLATLTFSHAAFGQMDLSEREQAYQAHVERTLGDSASRSFAAYVDGREVSSTQVQMLSPVARDEAAGRRVVVLFEDSAVELDALHFGSITH